MAILWEVKWPGGRGDKEWHKGFYQTMGPVYYILYFSLVPSLLILSLLMKKIWIKVWCGYMFPPKSPNVTCPTA